MKTLALSFQRSFGSAVRDFALLVKFRLTVLVVFSSVIAFLMSAEQFSFSVLFLLAAAGFLTTASANILNEVIEKDFDKLMLRTQNRPLPQERISVMMAVLLAGITGVAGIFLFLIYFNQLSAVLAALALLSYAFIYTPLKRFSPTAVLVGAFPGALPVLIGSVSAAGSITTFAWLLFAIQFVWQFPHFWSIAWVAFEDYNRAGYHLLPSSSGRSGRSAWYNIMYISVLIPVSLLPWYFELAGNFSALVISVTGILFLWQAIQLFRKQTESAARQLMFGSFFYLPIVQLALYFDKL